MHNCSAALVVHTQLIDQSKRLYLAAEKGDLATVGILLETLTVEEINRERFMWMQIVRCTALHAAVFNEHPAIVRAILSREGVNVNHEYVHNGVMLRYTVLHLASVRNLAEIVKLLVAYPSTDVNAKDRTQKTALHYAVNNRCIESVNALLAHPKIDVHARDENGRTALMAMCTDYDTAPYYWFTRNNPGPMNVAASALLEVLLAHSADVNDQDKLGYSALGLAATSGQVEALKALLLCPSVDVNAKSKAGLTPLLAVCSNVEYYHPPRNVKRVVEALVAHPQISVNDAASTGKTALIFAATLGYVNAVKILLQHPDIDCNAVDSDGNTALLCAMRCMTHQYSCRSAEFLQILQAIGAHASTDKSIENKKGLTALSLGIAFLRALAELHKKHNCERYFDELVLINALASDVESKGKIVSMSLIGNPVFVRQPGAT